MGNFNDFMFAKSLERLAEKCVRENINIIGYLEWYQEEGQYIPESLVGNMATGGLAGAGLGSYLGPWGTAAGAVAGGLYGAGKTLYDRYSKTGTAKQNVIDALNKFAAQSPGNRQVLGKIANYITNLPNVADKAGAGASPGAAPTPAGSPTVNPKSPMNIQRSYIQAAMKDPLIKDLGDDVIGNLAHNGIHADEFIKALKANEAGAKNPEEAVEKTLQQLRIHNRSDTPYRWNPSTSKFEHKS